MNTYKVTLVHREKVEVSAETPEDALRQAIGRVAKLPFTPQTQTVREAPPEADSPVSS